MRFGLYKIAKGHLLRLPHCVGRSPIRLVCILRNAKKRHAPLSHSAFNWASIKEYANMQPSDRAAAIQRIAEKIKDIRLAMFTTQEADGVLRSRPMATQRTDFDGTLWFFTLADAPKVSEVQHNQQVNVTYAKPDGQLSISISGAARLVRDQQRIHALWHPDLVAWFPNGEHDPNLALLEVTASEAEYWDAPTGPMVRLVGLAKSLITGEPTDQTGTNEHINL
jgi:general stress protein 26